MARFTRQQLQQLNKATADLIAAGGTASAQFIEFGERALLARYSLKNLQLIFGQCPDATYCQGYNQWRGAGRQVCKGAKGIAIRIPCQRKTAEGEPDEVYFSIGYIFDISQTEPLTTELDTASAPADLATVNA